MIRHKKGKNNVVVDAFSCRYALLSTFETKFLGFECIQELYDHDADFSDKYQTCSHTAFDGCFRHDGYLLRDKRLCVPRGSVRDLLIRDTHEEGLIRHIGVQKK